MHLGKIVVTPFPLVFSLSKFEFEKITGKTVGSVNPATVIDQKTVDGSKDFITIETNRGLRH